MYLLQTGRHILLYHVKPFPLFSGIQLFASGHLLVTKKNEVFFYCNTAYTSIYKFQKVHVQTLRQDQEKKADISRSLHDLLGPSRRGGGLLNLYTFQVLLVLVLLLGFKIYGETVFADDSSL